MEINKENVHPLGSYVMVEEIEGSLQGGYGIVAPDNMHRSVPTVGRIIKRGILADTIYEIGDIIMFRKYSVNEIEIEGADAKKEKIFFVSTEQDNSDIIATVK